MSPYLILFLSGICSALFAEVAVRETLVLYGRADVQVYPVEVGILLAVGATAVLHLSYEGVGQCHRSSRDVGICT